MKKILALILCCIIFGSIQINAQCKIANKYFDSGETLEMDLYIKYGLLNTKGGTSTLKLENANYNGLNAYKASLIANSSGLARKVFALDDTLSSFMTKAIVPLEFVKRAHEGKEHTQENIKYTYSNGNVNLHAKRIKNGTLRFDEDLTSTKCVYDMISVVYYARTLDYSKMKKGDEKGIEFISGKKKAYMVIEHAGIEKLKANDEKKYECIKLILSITDGNESAFSNKEEAMTVYITNDNNRMPVRLDSKLKIGSTRAILKSYSGNRYPITTY